MIYVAYLKDTTIIACEIWVGSPKFGQLLLVHILSLEVLCEHGEGAGGTSAANYNRTRKRNDDLIHVKGG